MSRSTVLLLALLFPSLLRSQTIFSDVGTTICKGTVVVMTAGSYADWEFRTNDGESWTYIGSAEKYASASIGNGYQYRASIMTGYDPFDPMSGPMYSYSNTLTFNVRGERAGLNTISDPSRGSLQFNGGQAYSMSPGMAVDTGAFTFEAWFRLNEAPSEQDMYALLGAGDNFKAVSVIIADPQTILYDSRDYGSERFTVPKLSLNRWYHLVMVRDASRNLSVFLDGTRSTSGVFTNTSDMTNNTGAIRYIGRNQGGNRFNGQIASFRMVVGTALYDPMQSSITVPASPLTNVTNTKVLLLANSDATKGVDGSGTQTLTADVSAPVWVANSPFRETVTASRTVSNSVAGGSWSSSNTSVATVDVSTGVITPVGNGNADITYSISSDGCISTDVTTLAIPCTWSGGTGNWNVAGNWTYGSVPDGSTDITVSSGTPTLNIDFTLPSGRSLTLSGSGSLVVAPGKTLTLAGTADFGSRPVTFKSDATGTASLGPVTGTLSNASAVTVERYIPAARKWRFLTAPLLGSANNSIFRNWQNNGTVSGATGIDIWGAGGSATPSTGANGLQTGPAASMRSYGASGWSDVTDTKGTALFTSSTNNAFSVFVKGPFNNGNTAVDAGTSATATTLSATGTPITGTHTKTLSASPTSGQYFLVGNPYASSVNPNLLSSVNLANTFWMWDATTSGGSGAGSYVAYNRSPGTYNVTSGGFANSPSQTQIQSGQAFFVRAASAGTPATITFEESDKTGGQAGGMFGPQQVPDDYGTLRLTLRAEDTSAQSKDLDGAVAFFYVNANAGVDAMDGAKMMNTSENLLFRREGRSLTFEHRPHIETRDTLFLRMSNLLKTTYRLKAEGSKLGKGMELLLSDRLTGKQTILQPEGESSYGFTVTDDSLSTGDRFTVLIVKQTTQTMSPDGPSVGEGLRLHPNPARGMLRVSLNVSGAGPLTMQVFDATGAEVIRRNMGAATSGRMDIDVSRLKAGLYTLLVSDASGTKTMGRFVRE